MVIGIGPGSTEKAGTMRRPLQVEIADRHQIHWRKSKRRIDVPECMAASADETNTQLMGVLVIVRNVQDITNVAELFADNLAIRRAEYDEEERF